MMDEFAEIQADIAAFADDEADVVIDSSGRILFTRAGRDVDCVARTSSDGAVTVEVDGSILPYRRFLTHYLAHLDVFATRILEKRPDLASFIDGPAFLESVAADGRPGQAVALLEAECSGQMSPFAARVVFITADAGHGKTVLLRHFQVVQARRFLEGSAGFVFWHVDLQGRQLLLLTEALMGDVTALRVPGLWMPAVIRLIRQRAIVLAIDGFDELAAEQGTSNALGALAMLVRQLEGRGVIVAASRRAFFDTDAYLQRARMFRQVATDACEFDQLSLQDWGPQEGIAYLTEVEEEGKSFRDAKATYQDLVKQLHGDAAHVILTRPFLLAHVARGLLRYDVTPADFIHAPADPFSGVASVVQAFVEREVSDKWRFRESGEPYLTVDQHMALLGAVAQVMYEEQTDRLSLDVIETIAATLFDDWHVDVGRRAQVMEMVRVHVMLTQPDDDARSRHFDHPEFREYFLAVAMRELLEKAGRGGGTQALGRLLSVAQVSDSTAGYVAGLVELSNEEVARVVSSLAELTRRERRPTFVQVNCGTLIPFFLNAREWDEETIVEGPLVFSSVVFERARITRVAFKGATLLNASFVGSALRGVRFER